MISIEELKEECIRRLRLLKLSEEVITKFEIEDTIYLSEIAGTLLEVNNDIMRKVQQLEADRKIKIYHIIHQKTQCKDIYCLLFVDRNKEQWKYEYRDLSLGYAVPVFYEKTLELKEIGIRSKDGKINCITI